MLIFATLAIVIATLTAGVFEFWLWRHVNLATESADESSDDSPSTGRRVSLLAEAIAGMGAILVLAGSGAAVSLRWLDLGSLGHAVILVVAALCFVVAGLLVRWFTRSVPERLTEALWCISIACMGGAAGFITAGGFHGSVAIVLLAVSATVAASGAALWPICRRELLSAVALSGLAGTVCGAILVTAGPTAPWLAAGLGAWLLGLAWAVLGWQYPQPLGNSVLLGVAIGLLAPAIAVHAFGWVYPLAIVTAGSVMAASIPLKDSVMLVIGSCAMFGYVTAVVLTYSEGSLDIAGTLMVVGALMIAVALITVWLARAVVQPPDLPTTPVRRSALPGEPTSVSRRDHVRAA